MQLTQLPWCVFDGILDIWIFKTTYILSLFWKMIKYWICIINIFYSLSELFKKNFDLISFVKIMKYCKNKQFSSVFLPPSAIIVVLLIMIFLSIGRKYVISWITKFHNMIILRLNINTIIKDQNQHNVEFMVKTLIFILPHIAQFYCVPETLKYVENMRHYYFNNNVTVFFNTETAFIDENH